MTEDGDGPAANTVDLSGVDPAAYTQLASTHLEAAAGADTMIGSFADDRIEGGAQDDTMRGIDGDDTLVWNNGEGTDEMDGGDGIDTIENNGGDTGPRRRTRTTPSRRSTAAQVLAPSGPGLPARAARSRST